VRRRRRLVPNDCIEVMEIRVALYLTPEGHAVTDYEISDPDTPEVTPPLHEVLGIIEMLKDSVAVYYREHLT
jgi:hypothetical protein